MAASVFRPLGRGVGSDPVVGRDVGDRRLRTSHAGACTSPPSGSSTPPTRSTSSRGKSATAPNTLSTGPSPAKAAGGVGDRGEIGCVSRPFSHAPVQDLNLRRLAPEASPRFRRLAPFCLQRVDVFGSETVQVGDDTSSSSQCLAGDRPLERVERDPQRCSAGGGALQPLAIPATALVALGLRQPELRLGHDGSLPIGSARRGPGPSPTQPSGCETQTVADPSRQDIAVISHPAAGALYRRRNGPIPGGGPRMRSH